MITIDSERIFKFLIDNGEVLILQPAAKEDPDEESFVDVLYRFGNKKLKGHLSFICRVILDGIHDNILKRYVEKSGFKNIEEWKNETRKSKENNRTWNLFRLCVRCLTEPLRKILGVPKEDRVISKI
ncbi:MAG: hypothetical protein ACFFA1_05185 [Promethearchaeota archaeon]